MWRASGTSAKTDQKRAERPPSGLRIKVLPAVVLIGCRLDGAAAAPQREPADDAGRNLRRSIIELVPGSGLNE